MIDPNDPAPLEAANELAEQFASGRWPPRIEVQHSRGLCFCGCGRKLGFLDNGVSKQGARVTACLEYLERYVRPFGEARGGETQESIEAFISDGIGFQIDLEMVVHGELEARNVDDRQLKHWMRECQHRERKLGSLMLRYGTPQAVVGHLAILRAEREEAHRRSSKALEAHQRQAEQRSSGPDPTKSARCPTCGRQFATRSGRDEHVAAKHRRERKPPRSGPAAASPPLGRAVRSTKAEPPNLHAVEVVAPEQELDLYSAHALREHLVQLIADGKTHIILDVSETVLDEDMLNLTGLAETVRNAGGTLVLVAPEPVVNVFKISRLDERLPVFASRDAALAALAS